MRPANQPPVPPLPPAPDAAGHLPLPLLRQYVAGGLPAAEQHRIEAHTLSCSRCAEVLEGLELTDAATTDQALSQLQHRLHQRVAQAEAPHRAAQAWRAMAAVVLLLLVGTAVWWGRRPSGKVPESAPIALQMPPARQPAPVESAAPSAPEPAPKPAPTVAAAPEPEATPAPVTAAAPPAARRRPARAARRRVVAAAAPTTAADALSDRAPSDAVAATAPVGTAPPAPSVALNTPTPASARPEGASATLAEKVAADTVSGQVAMTAKSKRTVPVSEEGAARKAALPPAAVISPQPVGGYARLREYLRRESLYVPEAPAPGLSGIVRVKFTVTAAGKLENFQIVRGLRRDYDAEAIRMLCDGPAWQPGAANGRRADQVVEISVSF